MLDRFFSRTAAAAVLAFAAAATSNAQYTPVFFDGFDIAETGDGLASLNLNQDIGFGRQGGVDFVPVEYVTNGLDSTNDYHHQLFPPSNGAQPLQLAADGFFPPMAAPIFAYKTMVSPDVNFNGTLDSGVVGKRITFTLDVATFADDTAGFGVFTTAGITIGGDTTLIDSEDQIAVQEILPVRDSFGLHFVEDSFNSGGTETATFAQAFDSGFIIEDPENSGVVLPHDAGTDPLFVQLDIDDPADGNPWDGVGSTVIEVSVNNSVIYTYERADGGFTNNFITLYGNRNLAGNGLATHVFDNLTVFAAPTETVPGDYNFDGVVNAADYTVFRDNLLTEINLPGENPAATTPGFVDAEDYDFWRDNFGATAAVAVPEPTALAGALIGMLATARRR